MSATDELRRMLDENGVEWWAEDDPEEPAYYFVTKWVANGCEQTYEEIPAIRSRSLKAYCVSPEQAIAATLGGGECEIETTENWLPAERYHRCKHCGAFFAVMNASGDIQPCVCPNCGKAVKR